MRGVASPPPRRDARIAPVDAERLVTDLVDEIRRALRARADPARAPQQQSYMKSAMPFLGVGVPVVRRIARAQAKAAQMDGETLRDAALTLWDDAAYREERYAAMSLLAMPPASVDSKVVPVV